MSADLASALLALRAGAAWSRMDHVTHLALRGDDAFALLDRTVAAELLMRDGQSLQSLLLHDDGTPWADVYVGRADEDFFLFAEGPTAPDLLAWLRDRTAPGERVEIEHLDETHAPIGLHGPYAWELLGELLGPEIGGLPYGAIFHVDGWRGLRAGKTGEYGYELLLPRDQAETAHARLADAGARFDLVEIGLDALDHAALENWFFNIRREGRCGLSPLELQLQWRVSYRKDYPGAEALRRRREAGVARRVTYVVAPADRPLQVGDRVRADDDREVGTILNAGYCAPRDEQVALALLDRACAWPALDGFTIERDHTPLRTVTPPLIANRSLYVSPQRHSYATRADDEFPPLHAPHE